MTFYSKYSMDLSRVVSEILNIGNVVILKSGKEVKVIESGTIR